MGTGVRGGGFTFDVCSVGGMWTWRVTASNVHGQGQLYQVEDIRTPFGPLAATDIPLPGEVVTAMADSLNTFQQQLQPRVQLTSPASLSLTVTEGDVSTSAGSITFTNAGALGSFMNAVGSPDSPWLSADPPSVQGVGKNASAQMGVRVDARTMLATSSPYAGHLNLQDNANPSNVVPVTVNVTVLPKPALTLDTDTVLLTFYLSSGVPGGTASVVIENSGSAGSVLNFSMAKVQNISPWLSFAPVVGSGLPSGGQVTSVFSVVSAQVPHIPGVYTEIIRVSSPSASNGPKDIAVQLTVIP